MIILSLVLIQSWMAAGYTTFWTLGGEDMLWDWVDEGILESHRARLNVRSIDRLLELAGA